MTVSNVVKTLSQYAMSKKGAQLEYGQELTDDLTHPSIKLAGASWGNFFEVSSGIDFLDEDDADTDLDDDELEHEVAPKSINLPVLKARFEQLQKLHPTIRESEWMERDGHMQMSVPLELPIEFLKSLIDEGYELIWKKLTSRQSYLIEQASQPFDSVKLLDDMIDRADLSSLRSSIHGLVRRAALLRTKAADESMIPCGATKMGGSPDLPISIDWPVYHDGRPLPFLCQIDLRDVAAHGVTIAGLPTHGVVSVFSAWGWVCNDSGDPQLPEDDWDTQDGWSQILFLDSEEKLERRKAPKKCQKFKAAAVEMIPVLSLPNHREEPTLSAMRWNDEVLERFDAMQGDYRAVVLGHWLRKLDCLATHHLLGGYAMFQQQFPDALLGKDVVMLLQIGTDDRSQMYWGDGGEVTFYVDARAMNHGRFEMPWGECQGG